MYLLPPANVVCEGYVFTGVCLSTAGGGVLHPRGVLHREGFSIPGGGVLHPGGGGSPSRGGGVLHPGGVSIRSMCRRYASYWNAFLLLGNFMILQIMILQISAWHSNQILVYMLNHADRPLLRSYCGTPVFHDKQFCQICRI